MKFICKDTSGTYPAIALSASYRGWHDADLAVEDYIDILRDQYDNKLTYPLTVEVSEPASGWTSLYDVLLNRTRQPLAARKEDER